MENNKVEIGTANEIHVAPVYINVLFVLLLVVGLSASVIGVKTFILLNLLRAEFHASLSDSLYDLDPP